MQFYVALNCLLSAFKISRFQLFNYRLIFTAEKTKYLEFSISIHWILPALLLNL